MVNLLKNAGFEGNWWRKTHTGQEFGEIFVPEQWVAFWKQGGPVPHDPGNPIGYGRPEMHVINRESPFLNPPRIYSGNRAAKLFTFYRIHDAGYYQRVEGITPGTRLRGSGWAHAWSSGQDDPYVSDGVGAGPFFVRAIDYDKVDSVRNFTFTVGIDPTGGTDPWAGTVVWGEGAHIYNGYAQIPPVETTAQGTAVTFFVRSAVLWPFKHCDAYFDEMELVVVESAAPLTLTLSSQEPTVGEPFEVLVAGGTGAESLTLTFEGGEVFQSPVVQQGDVRRWRCVAVKPGPHLVKVMTTGQALQQRAFTVRPCSTGGGVISGFVPPREDYARTYLLLPPAAGNEWLRAVIESGVWDKYHWTIGSSADDAGIGPTVRKVIAINPHGWPGDLKAFFERYYAGVDYVAIKTYDVF